MSVVASNALRDRYYQQLAAEAAEAGGKMAEECLRGAQTGLNRCVRVVAVVVLRPSVLALAAMS